MITAFLQKIFGTRNQRLIEKYKKYIISINSFEPKIKNLTNDQLRSKTSSFRNRIIQGESLDEILPEAFSVCREASYRVLRMKHFDVQLIGGIVLHKGKIAEMRTGEGKTLVATLTAYLNSLSGLGVHIITVNDYLAKRDAEWMGPLYNFLNLKVGINLSQTNHINKQRAYSADITYGTNNEFGFDYLRDNMIFNINEKVQRGLNFAIIDEVDSILIDEARTPLIISGHSEDQTNLYLKINLLPPLLNRQIGEDNIDFSKIEKPGDYIVDEKLRQVYLTEFGHEKAEKLLFKWGMLNDKESLYNPNNIILMHHVYAALRAHTLFHCNQHYVVQNNQVIIVDEFTGRLMPGRRWSDGIHQAIEAKEMVKIQNENQTLASITFQNYFRMYKKLSGMTGTAYTESYEFKDIYGLETIVIPTNRKSKRIDLQDQIYKTSKEKYNAVISDIMSCYKRGQPVLVGTTSIENSELLSKLLKKYKLPHNVLNAKQHDLEAKIIAEAGEPKSITIATNMAGRGTDIVLGGNIEKKILLIEDNTLISLEEKKNNIKKLYKEWDILHKQVKKSGGLHIIGTERHESRRIDNQLRGRSGRQGDPGSSRFYLSLEDKLLRIFIGDGMRIILDKLKMPDGEAIEAKIVSRSIESAQNKVESRNFDIRKQLLEYDNVANDQRKVIYTQRNELLESNDITTTIKEIRHSLIIELVNNFIQENIANKDIGIYELCKKLNQDWNINIEINDKLNNTLFSHEKIIDYFLFTIDKIYTDKASLIGNELFTEFERSIMLQVLDRNWREHISILDDLRQGIHLRGYAQKNPKEEYKRESFILFSKMLNSIKTEVTKILMIIEPTVTKNLEKSIYNNSENNLLIDKIQSINDNISYNKMDINNSYIKNKISRNTLCPCGTGKKYKRCHGKLN